MNDPQLFPRNIRLSIEVGLNVDAQRLASLVLDDVLSRLICQQVDVRWVTLDIAGPLTTT